MVRAQHFCCCIPVRFGVFVMSLAILAFYGLLAAGAWYSFDILNDPNQVAARTEVIKDIANSLNGTNFNLTLPNTNQTFVFNGTAPFNVSAFNATAANTTALLDELTHGNIKTVNIVLGVVAGYLTLVALSGLVGLIGSIARNTGAVRFFGGFLWISLILNLILGVASIVVTFKQAGSTLSKGLMIGLFIVEFLVMLYGAIIVHRYKHQLEDQEDQDNAWAHHAAHTRNQSYSSFEKGPAQPNITVNVGGAGAGAASYPGPMAGGYPYSAPHNAYGSNV